MNGSSELVRATMPQDFISSKTVGGMRVGQRGHIFIHDLIIDLDGHGWISSSVHVTKDDPNHLRKLIVERTPDGLRVDLRGCADSRWEPQVCPSPGVGQKWIEVIGFVGDDIARMFAGD